MDKPYSLENQGPEAVSVDGRIFISEEEMGRALGQNQPVPAGCGIMKNEDALEKLIGVKSDKKVVLYPLSTFNSFYADELIRRITESIPPSQLF